VSKTLAPRADYDAIGPVRVLGLERHLAVGVLRVPGEPRSLPLVGPCEVRKECSQRLEGLRAVIVSRTNHMCTQEWPTRCRDLVRVHGIHLQVGISSGGPR
jgi:hypothetical protein